MANRKPTYWTSIPLAPTLVRGWYVRAGSRVCYGGELMRWEVRGREPYNPDDVAERPVHGGDALLLLHRVPADGARQAAHASQADVLIVGRRDGVFLRRLVAAVEPRDGLEARPGQALTRRQRAQPLLARDNYLCSV